LGHFGRRVPCSWIDITIWNFRLHFAHPGAQRVIVEVGDVVEHA